ncbi:MAG: LamG domain-containing protein [Steroidobacteraceae bacterium]
MTPSRCGSRIGPVPAATGSESIKLIAPPDETVGSAKTFPTSPAAFQSTVYPLLSQYCSRCHSPTALTPQQPYFASADINEAYSNAQAKMNLDDPALSRFVVRLGTEFHNCWSDCATDAAAMLTQITNSPTAIAPTQVDPSLVISKALTMYDGTVASSQNRYTTSQIALYEFKTGTGTIAYDTSGVEPELDLNLTGNYNLGRRLGRGIRARLQGPGHHHRQCQALQRTHLYRRVQHRGVGLACERRANRCQHRQLLGWPEGAQCDPVAEAFQYQANVRSSVTDTNGAPALVTSPTNMLAQAALQHVVMTYDPVNGRKIYVDGVFSGDVDAAGGGTLANWDNTFALVVGNETSGTANQFQGELRMVAIHNRALTLAQIQQNYAAGVGQKILPAVQCRDTDGCAAGLRHDDRQSH